MLKISLRLPGLALLFGMLLLSGCGQNPASPQTSNAPLGAQSYSTDADGNVDWSVDLSPSGHGAIPGVGQHVGELKALEVEISYLRPSFYTSEGYAAYYIGQTMAFEIHLRNTSNRTFKHLDLTCIQEYHESGTCDRWWYPYPQQVTYSQGEALPGDATTEWKDFELGPRAELVLTGSFTSGPGTCPGLDQTHLILQHTNSGRPLAAAMYYNPQAAIFCPPAPAR